MQLQKSLSARGTRAASARRVVVVKAIAAPEAIKALNTTRSDEVRFRRRRRRRRCVTGTHSFGPLSSSQVRARRASPARLASAARPLRSLDPDI